MSVDTAAADRLPWLSDDPPRQGLEQRHSERLFWVIAALAVIAGGGLWIGVGSIRDEFMPSPQQLGTSTTVLLPPPSAAAPQARTISQPGLGPVRASHAAPIKEARASAPMLPPHTARGRKKQKRPALQVRSATKAATASIASSTSPHSGATAGAAAPVIEIGAFGSAEQAKRGWSSTLHANPALAHLSAKAVESRNSHGRTFYRMQVRTTSQTHSEVLCQRMVAIGLSCAVVGLPWKAKVER